MTTCNDKVNKKKSKEQSKEESKEQSKEDQRKVQLYMVASQLKLLCDKSSINNYTIGMYIRAWHIMSPIYGIFFMFYISKFLYHLFIAGLLFVFILFIYFKGCILTILEKKLCGDMFTIFDPILEFNNIELNSKNRYDISLLIAILYFVVTFTIYYYRFNKQ